MAKYSTVKKKFGRILTPILAIFALIIVALLLTACTKRKNDLNHDGKVDFEDAELAMKNAKHYRDTKFLPLKRKLGITKDEWEMDRLNQQEIGQWLRTSGEYIRLLKQEKTIISEVLKNISDISELESKSSGSFVIVAGHLVGGTRAVSPVFLLSPVSENSDNFETAKKVLILIGARDLEDEAMQLLGIKVVVSGELINVDGRILVEASDLRRY